MVEHKVRLGPKGQLVIPKLLRDQFKLQPRGEVLLKEEKDGVLIKNAAPQAYADTLAGIAGEARKGMKGKFVYRKQDIYEQYERRARKPYG